MLFEGSLDDLKQNALRSGFATDNLEDMFLSMIENDNISRKREGSVMKTLMIELRKEKKDWYIANSFSYGSSWSCLRFS